MKCKLLAPEVWILLGHSFWSIASKIVPLRGRVDISAGIRRWCRWREPGSSPGAGGHTLSLRVKACVFVAGTAQRPESVSGRRGPCPVYRARSTFG